MPPFPTLPIRRRGWLKNGNPPGDPNTAPRCGAKLRGKDCTCRAPAMKNGRCRLHGGLSTRPRTPEDLERSRKASWKHGKRVKTSGLYQAMPQAAEPNTGAITGTKWQSWITCWKLTSQTFTPGSAYFGSIGNGWPGVCWGCPETLRSPIQRSGYGTK
ncbi:MAG: HGGxSTG domain-containing protein [Terriglobia bacterium]